MRSPCILKYMNVVPSLQKYFIKSNSAIVHLRTYIAPLHTIRFMYMGTTDLFKKDAQTLC